MGAAFVPYKLFLIPNWGVNARRMCPCLLVTYFFDIKGLKIVTWIVHIYVARLTERCIIILFNNKTYFYYNNKT